MDSATRRLVRQRAAFRCEYCQLLESDSELSHHIEHILTKQHSGSNDPINLALACHRCNLHKGPNIAGLNPATGEIVPLFNPRHDLWEEHFRWEGIFIVGLTPTGRATVRVLALNSSRRLQLRSEIQAD